MQRNGTERTAALGEGGDTMRLSGMRNCDILRNGLGYTQAQVEALSRAGDMTATDDIVELCRDKGVATIQALPGWVDI